MIKNDNSNIETNYKFLTEIKISLLTGQIFWEFYFTCHKFI